MLYAPRGTDLRFGIRLERQGSDARELQIRPLARHESAPHAAGPHWVATGRSE